MRIAPAKVPLFSVFANIPMQIILDMLLADVFHVSALFPAASCDSESLYSDHKNYLLKGTTTLKACLFCPVMEG